MDFSKISDEFAREIVREGEAYLAGQLQIATSADQRAAVMASVFAAAGAAFLAVIITVVSDTNNARTVFPIILGGTAAGISFLIGASCCVRATMPCSFWTPGSEPDNWKGEIATGAELKAALGEQSGHIQDKIDDNNTVLERNALWFKWGGRLGIAAPFAGLIVWLLSSACRLAWG